MTPDRDNASLSPGDTGLYVEWVAPREFDEFYADAEGGPLSVAVAHLLGSATVWAQLRYGLRVRITMPPGSRVLRAHILAAQQVATAKGYRLDVVPRQPTTFILRQLSPEVA